MGRKRPFYQEKQYADLILPEAFGYSDDQLAAEYDHAANAERAACVPSAPAEEFERIWARVESICLRRETHKKKSAKSGDPLL